MAKVADINVDPFGLLAGVYGASAPTVTFSTGETAVTPDGSEVKILKGDLSRVSFWYDPTPRARTFAEWAFNQRAALRSQTRDEVLRAAVRLSRTNSPSFLGAVGKGFEQIGTGASLGGQLGGAKGAAIGAASAALVGFVGAIVPVARIETENQWRTICGGLTPIERYGVFSKLGPIARMNAQAEGKIFPGGNANDPLGPWRWADDPLAGHTPFGGPVSRSVGLYEILFDFPCVPDVSGDSEVEQELLALYILCVCAGANDDEKRMWSIGPWGSRIANGKVAPQFVARFGKYSQWYVGTVREQAQRYGIRSIFNPPITPSIRRALTE